MSWKPSGYRERVLVPTLVSDRLLLRRFRPEDVDAFKLVVADPAVCVFDDYPMADMAVREYVSSSAAIDKGCWSWAICERHSGFLIGEIGISAYQWLSSACNLWYRMNSAFWGNGVMSEATSLLVCFLQSKTDYQCLAATVADANWRSLRIMNKLGFSQFRACSYGVRGTDKLFDAHEYVLGLR